jgi:hypothetical protein
LPEKCDPGKTTGYKEVQVPHFFYKIPDLFEKYNLAPNIIFNVNENDISTVPTLFPKVIPEN